MNSLEAVEYALEVLRQLRPGKIAGPDRLAATCRHVDSIAALESLREYLTWKARAVLPDEAPPAQSEVSG